MDYTNHELADMVFIYGSANGNAHEARRLYQERFPTRRLPDRKTFERVFRRLGETGQFKALTVNYGAPREIRTVDLEERILQRVETEREISIRQLSREFGIGVATVWDILHEDNLYPYHLQRVQALCERDYPLRLNFSEWFQQQVHANPYFLPSLWFTDESKFTQSGIFNFHNQHIWHAENPHGIVQAHHQQRFSLNVWGGLIGNQLFGPYFIQGNLNGASYLHFLRNEFQEMLNEFPLEIRSRMWFMHDGAPPHITCDVRTHLSDLFPQRWIGRYGPIAWPARSPDLNVMDYFVWGTLKSIVYVTPVNNVEELRQKIIDGFQQIRNMEGILNRALQSMNRRVEACILANGGHFEHLL